MAIAAMIAWVLTASIGAYMLRTWVTRGGLRRQRATGVGVPPPVVFGHASAALAGLLIWLGFVDTGLDLLAWLGVTVVACAIALGVCTVTLWTPYPVAAPPAQGGRGGLGGTASPQEQGGSRGIVPPVPARLGARGVWGGGQPPQARGAPGGRPPEKTQISSLTR